MKKENQMGSLTRLFLKPVITIKENNKLFLNSKMLNQKLLAIVEQIKGEAAVLLLMEALILIRDT
jgi:hypothetical protein